MTSTTVVGFIMQEYQEQTLRYIRERRVASGGYCFYRLDEPNAADTFYALNSLRLLDTPVTDDAATLAYLHGFQHPDGTYGNIFIGNAVIQSLLLLGERPAHDPARWLAEALVLPDEKNRPTESVSGFEHLMLAVEAGTALGIPFPEKDRERTITGILRYRNDGGGFGTGAPTLIETYHAMTALAGLGYKPGPPDIVPFLRQCEDEEFGFIPLPDVRPGFLEHIHAGLAASALAGHRPKFSEACKKFLRHCYRENGGYCRSFFGGSATLEHTWRALSCRAIIGRMENHA